MDTLTVQGLISSDEIRELLELRHDAIYDTSGNFNAKRFIQLETKYEYWEQRIEKILKDRHTEDDFIEAGFISVGQGYLNTSIKGVAGFSVNDMTIINPMIFNEIYGESFHHKISQIEAMDLPYYVRQTYKMACIGCRDGLFVCPTVTFEDTPTSGRSIIINIVNGIIQTSAIHVRYSRI